MGRNRCWVNINGLSYIQTQLLSLSKARSGTPLATATPNLAFGARTAAGVAVVARGGEGEVTRRPWSLTTSERNTVTKYGFFYDSLLFFLKATQRYIALCIVHRIFNAQLKIVNG